MPERRAGTAEFTGIFGGFSAKTGWLMSKKWWKLMSLMSLENQELWTNIVTLSDLRLDEHLMNTRFSQLVVNVHLKHTPADVQQKWHPKTASNFTQRKSTMASRETPIESMFFFQTSIWFLDFSISHDVPMIF